MTEIWIFNGNNASFPSAVFSTKQNAEQWIKIHKLSGCLTKYPVDISVYDWAVQQSFFTVKKDYQKDADFVANFSSASLEHEHYENEE